MVVVTVGGDGEEEVRVGLGPIKVGDFALELVAMEEVVVGKVPNIKGKVHFETAEKVEVCGVEEDIGYTDLAEGEDLLKF